MIHVMYILAARLLRFLTARASFSTLDMSKGMSEIPSHFGVRLGRCDMGSLYKLPLTERAIRARFWHPPTALLFLLH